MLDPPGYQSQEVGWGGGQENCSKAHRTWVSRPKEPLLIGTPGNAGRLGPQLHPASPGDHLGYQRKKGPSSSLSVTS